MSIVKTYKPNDNQNNPSPQDAVVLTEAALAHLKTMLAKRGSGKGMRLSVQRYGCSGYGYVVDFIDEINPEDHIFPIANEALVIAVDAQSYPMVKGTCIDFTRNGLNETFTYRNPNQRGECGCGESFSVGE